MSTISDFSGALTFTAPVGGTTAGTVVNVSTVSKIVVYPYTTAASGATFQGYVGTEKVIQTVPKLSTAAWVVGQALAWATATSQFTQVTTGAVATVAHAAAAAATGDTTGDVCLCWPSPLSPA